MDYKKRKEDDKIFGHELLVLLSILPTLIERILNGIHGYVPFDYTKPTCEIKIAITVWPFNSQFTVPIDLKIDFYSEGSGINIPWGIPLFQLVCLLLFVKKPHLDLTET